MPDIVAPEFLELQQALLGRYSLERELGRGGMGIVFLARDVALDRPVAIKLLPPAMAAQPELRARFLAEARTAAKLSQPNIVPIHAVEEVGRLVFFVMSYVEGESLGERLRTRGPLAPSEAARMLQEVAWALAYAHGRGVVHRDVKPDNIMLERGTGRALVMDFGIAGTTLESGRVLGTAQYIAPEQASGDPVDGRADLYALGVVGFLAISGRLPFEAEDSAGYIAQHVTKPAPLLASVMPGAPRKLARAVDRCLVKNPADRFPTGEALAEAVAQGIEPKRELPIPVRIWVTPGNEVRAGYLVWYGFLGFPGAFLVGGALMQVLGVPSAVAVAAGIKTYALTPLGVHFLNRLWQLRKLLASGYGEGDVRLAVREQAERRREEVTYEFGGPPPTWAKVVHYVRIGSLATFITVLSGAAARIMVSEPFQVAAVVSGLTAIAGTLLNHYWPGKSRTQDSAAEWRLKFWNSRFGGWFAKLAGFAVKRRGAPAEMTWRPTEMAIGLAADALFDTLPKAQKKELKELPGVLERLQKDAQLMRRTVDELNDAIASLGEGSDTTTTRAGAHASGESGEALAGTRDKLRSDLVVRRDQAAARLAEAVTALEGLRLNLLRLKAGTGTVSELTADLASARQVGDELSLAADAAREVEKLLGGRTSRSGELTPHPGGAHGG